MIPRSTVVFPEPAAPIRTNFFPDFAVQLHSTGRNRILRTGRRILFLFSFFSSGIRCGNFIVLGKLACITKWGIPTAAPEDVFFAAIAASLSLIVRVLTGFSASGWLIAFLFPLTRVL